MSFSSEVHVCCMCGDPIEKPEPQGTRLTTKGWLHTKCAIARDVAERLNPSKPDFKSAKGMEVRNKDKFIISRND